MSLSHISYVDNAAKLFAQQDSNLTTGIRQNQLYSQPTGTTTDNQDLLYNKVNHSYDITQKVSIRVDKPNLISAQVQSVLHHQPSLARTIIKQANIMFLFLRIVLINQYQSYIIALFPADDDQLQRELFIQRIIQHFLLDTLSPLLYILQPSILMYYGNAQKLRRESVQCHQNSPPNVTSFGSEVNNTIRHEPVLHQKLLPGSIKEGSECNHCSDCSEDSSINCSEQVPQTFKNDNLFAQIIYEEKCEEECITPLLKFHAKSNFQDRVSLSREEVIHFIRQSEVVVQNNQIPYHQTFSLVHKVIQSSKPWKKFKWILKIDQKIIDVFMKSRSKSQEDQHYDTISSAENKFDIIFFILYKFRMQHQQIDLEKSLLFPLKFMYEFDGFIHKDLKDVLTPAFLRFYSIVALLLNSEV